MKARVWECDQCHGIYWPQVVAATGKCPGCGNPTGKERDKDAAESKGEAGAK